MLVSALILGLMGSLHCVGMCGPIAFMLPVDRTNNYKKFGQIFIYHFGRLLAYGIIGLIFGLLGKGLSIFGIQQKLSIVIGIIMIVFGGPIAFDAASYALDRLATAISGAIIVLSYFSPLNKEFKK